MRINIFKLRNYVIELSNIIDTIEVTIHSYYFELNQTSFFWQDPLSQKFYQDLEEEKKQILIHLSELKELRNVYQKMVNTYELIGENISFNKANKNKFLQKLTTYATKINNLQSSYQQLDFFDESLELPKHLLTIESVKETIDNYQNYAEQIMDNIDQNNQQISKEIKKLNSTKLSEKEIFKYLQGEKK